MKFLIANRWMVFIVTMLYLAAGIIVWFATRAFYFEGDSAMHYLIARYAPQHLELFFDHWGKPFFTLAASPFAQFGTDGIVFFNLLCMAGASWFTYKTAVNLKIQYSPMVPILFLFTPFVFLATLSGLTEPFSAFLFSVALFLFTGKKLWQAAVVLSFLPFCRSEGLILISGFAFIFIWRGKWLPLFLLATGTVLYSVAGWLSGKEILWAFTEIPYANLNSPYGSGGWSDMAVALQYVTGIPVYVLMVAGLAFLCYLLLKRRIKLFSDELFSSALPFILFLAFHTIAWATGSFSSMGLKRVFVTVLPCIALLAARGLEWTDLIPGKKRIAGTVKSVIVLYLLVFPFMPNPAAFRFPCEFRSKPEHIIFKALAESAWIAEKRIYCSHPFMAVYANRDPFDANSYKMLNEWNQKTAKTSDVLIWDNWFAKVESSIGLESMQENAILKQQKEIQIDFCGKQGHVVIFTVE